MKAEVIKQENGTYELGAKIDGVFVPFASLPDTHVATLVQAGKTNGDGEGGGGGEGGEPGA